MSTLRRCRADRGLRIRERSVSRILRQLPLVRDEGLTPIMLLRIVQYPAHANETRSIHEAESDQAGAPGSGVRVQSPAPVAHSDGTDGADTALYRRDRLCMPPSEPASGARDGAIRPRGLGRDPAHPQPPGRARSPPRAERGRQPAHRPRCFRSTESRRGNAVFEPVGPFCRPDFSPRGPEVCEDSLCRNRCHAPRRQKVMGRCHRKCL
jgi:hypothetical protein